MNMCVGISGKVVKASGDTVVIDVSGATRQVSADLLSDLEPGDYVMVHAGVAIAKITDTDAHEASQVLAAEQMQSAAEPELAAVV